MLKDILDRKETFTSRGLKYPHIQGGEVSIAYNKIDTALQLLQGTHELHVLFANTSDKSPIPEKIE
jgi:hypothetical protein